ncbi:uncharacterized protein LOC133779624 [Humulus lupulus]|uniref:uncharacterized protein LOC133779624 n=1 Tax=Humulus lupulus TaxID=3486 RepID=UPI002B405DED|nr:uncharacterized protein LOC133779624 [Humulus lupulus]
MDSINVFDIYSTPEVAAASPSKKKTRKRHHGESSKVPQAKKPRNAGPPEDRPSATTTPSSPRKQQIPPAPARSTPPPAALTDQTQQADPASTGGDITGHAFKLVKERVAKIVKHDHCREAMAVAEAMDVDLILNRGLNEFTSAMLTLTAGHIRSGAVTEQARTLEQQHEDELKAAEAKYAEQLAVVLEEKAKLAKQLEEKQRSMDKAREQRDQFKESNRFNFHAAQQLEEDLGANFDYLPENARDAELAHCATQLAEEERSRVPASPEISLATGMDGADNEAVGIIDQGPTQDPPAT